LLDNDSDADDDELSITAVSAASNGDAVLGLGGAVTYKATSDTATSDTFTYTLSDGTTDVVATVNVIIEPVDDPTTAADDVVTVAEGGSGTVDVLDNDADPDEILGTPEIGASPTNGTAEVNGEGDVDYTHNGSETTSDSFTYTIDGTEATVTVTVEATDDAPVAVDDDITEPVDEGTSVTVNVVENDTDVDDGPLTVTSVTEPTFGTTEIVANEIVYTSTGSDLGEVTFDYTLNDGGVVEGGEATDTVATVTLTVVNAIDDPPSVDAPDPISVDEDADPTTIEILSDSAVDVDGEALSLLSVTEPPKGTATIDGGNIIYTPDPDANGPDSFDVVVTDGTAPDGNDDQTLTVTVEIAPVNDAPVSGPDGPFPNVGEDSVATFNVLANDSDVDDLELSIDALTLLDGEGEVAVVEGAVQYTPAPDFYGPFSFSYAASDGELSSEPTTVSGFVINFDDPLVATADEASVEEDDVVYVDVLDNDIDVDDTGFSLISVTQPENGFAALAGDRVRVEPDPDATGVLEFEYTIQATHPVDGGFFFFRGPGISCADSGGIFFGDIPGCELITGTVTVTVEPRNDRPDSFGDDVTTDEDTAITIDVLENDTDADGDDLAIHKVNAPRNGTTEVQDGQVVYTPEQDFFGSDSFVYFATDGELLSVAVVTVDVQPVNDDPTIEGEELETDEDTSVSTLVSIADVDSDDLTLEVDDSDEGIEVTVVGRTVTVTPDDNVNGSFSFTLIVSDDADGSATAEFSVDVVPVNDTPIIEASAIALDEDDDPYSGEVEVDDVEDDIEALVIEVTEEPTLGTVEFAGTDFVFTPNPDANGEDEFTVTVTDSEGASAEVTIDVVINAINDDPELVEQQVETDEDTPIEFEVEMSDVDGDDLTAEIVEWSEIGELDIDGSTVSYTPPPDYNGEVAFELIVTDGEGGEAVGFFEIEVVSVNDIPEIADTELTVEEDGEGSVSMEASDVEDDFGRTPLTFSIETAPSKGTAEVDGDTVTYTPDADANGDDELVVKVTDSNGGEATAVVEITITPVQDAPVAAECEGATVEAGKSIELDAPSCGTDVDGDALMAVAESGEAAEGEVAIDEEGVVTYTAAKGYEEAVVITVSFVLTDGIDEVESSIEVEVTPWVNPYIGASGIDGELVRVYSAMLGRLPDEPGFDYWTGLREEGLDLAEMITYFGTSDEFVMIYGDRLTTDTDLEWIRFVYNEILDREPDPAGQAYWEELLGSGEVTREEMVVFFAQSEEYKLITQTE
ncbi:MAG: Ig-like domain-containing protein, partial [Acidimicrobiales bacterium]